MESKVSLYFYSYYHVLQPPPPEFHKKWSNIKENMGDIRTLYQFLVHLL